MRILRGFNLVAILGIVVNTASVFSASEKTDIRVGQNETEWKHGDLGVEKDDVEKERDHNGSDKSNETISSIEEIQGGDVKNVTEVGDVKNVTEVGDVKNVTEVGDVKNMTDVGEEAKSKETEGDKGVDGEKDDKDAKDGKGEDNDDGKKDGDDDTEYEADYSSDEAKITTTTVTTIETTRDPDADHDKYKDRSSEKWYLKFRDDHNLIEPYQLPSNKRIVELEDVRFCRCPRVYWPTCGTDNITYMNVCIMKCLHKTLKRYGPCIVYRRKEKSRQYHSTFTPSI